MGSEKSNPNTKGEYIRLVYWSRVREHPEKKEKKLQHHLRVEMDVFVVCFGVGTKLLTWIKVCREPAAGGNLDSYKYYILQYILCIMKVLALT